MLRIKFNEPLLVVTVYFSILNLIETLVRISLFGQNDAGLVFQVMATTAIIYGVLESKNFESILIISKKNSLTARNKKIIIFRENLILILSFVISTLLNFKFYNDEVLFILLGASSATYYSAANNFKLVIASDSKFNWSHLIVILSRSLFILIQSVFIFDTQINLTSKLKFLIILQILITTLLLIISNKNLNVKKIEIENSGSQETYSITNLTFTNWIVSTLSSIYKQIDVIFVAQIASLSTVSIFKVFQQILAPLTMFIEMMLQKKTHTLDSSINKNKPKYDSQLLKYFLVITLAIILLIFVLNFYFSFKASDYLLIIPMYFQSTVAYFSGSLRLSKLFEKKFKIVNFANIISVVLYLIIGFIFISVSANLLLLLFIKLIMSLVNLIVLKLL